MGVQIAALWRRIVNGQRIVGGLTYNEIAEHAMAFAAAGFTVVQFPPSCKTQSGTANNADGYGKYDDYDIGSKNQSYAVPTFFGSADELRRAVAIVHACGMQVYGDIVLHQYDGGNNGSYAYKGSGQPGRFPKTPSCFVGAPPRVAVDPVFDGNGNFGFGDMCSYVNSTPKGYMANGAIAAGDWLVRTVGLDGFRIDDTKGMNVGFVRFFATSYSMADKFCYGECFVGDPAELNTWVWNSGMNGRASTLDFTAHWHLQGVCDSGENASNLLSEAYFKHDPIHAVTFTDNADTDATDGQQIIANKGLAYWFILTSEGYPQVYYKDYSADAGCYGLKPLIDNLVWIHENLAKGGTKALYGDSKAIVYQRTDEPGLLCAGNWDTWNKKPLTVQTNFGSNVQLHDYTGHHPDIWTDANGKASFTIPSNAYGKGQSYLAFSRVGYSAAVEIEGRSTKQAFFGAADLDSGPAVGGSIVTVGRIWCDAGTRIILYPGASAKGLTFGLHNPAGLPMALSAGLKASAATRGWYTLVVTADATVASQDYEITVEYTGTQGLLASEVQ